MFRRRLSRFTAIVIALVAASVLTLPGTSGAATIQVTNTNNSGTGSLRAAINQANALPGFDTIVIGATGAMRPQSELPDLKTNLAIQGPGRDKLFVHGCSTACEQEACGPWIGCFSWVPPTFAIVAGAAVTVKDLSILGGYCSGGNCDEGIIGQGVVGNSGTLSLQRIRVYDSSDAGVYNHTGGTLTVAGSIVRNTVTAITNDGGSLTVKRSHFPGVGGACSRGAILYNGGGTMDVSQSTISGDAACNAIVNSRATTNVRLTTVAHSGGIYNQGGTLAVEQSTVVGSYSAGIRGAEGGVTTVKSTILDNNEIDCDDAVISRGYNISDDVHCPFTATGDLANTEPLLRPFGSYGGPTPTYALRSASPAVDAGFAGDVATDQRGALRIVDYPGVPMAVGGDNSDIGAFELKSP